MAMEMLDRAERPVIDHLDLLVFSFEPLMLVTIGHCWDVNEAEMSLFQSHGASPLQTDSS